jgi:hypothetical protein
MEMQYSDDEGETELCDNPTTSSTSNGEATMQPATSVPSTSESHATSTVLLSELTSDDTIEGDSAFLDDMKILFEKHSTFTLFIPYFFPS